MITIVCVKHGFRFFKYGLFIYFYFRCIAVLPAWLSMGECQILELQTGLSCHVGAENWTQSLWKSGQCSNHWAIPWLPILNLTTLNDCYLWNGRQKKDRALLLTSSRLLALLEVRLFNTFRISLASKQQTSMCCSLLNRDRQEQTEDRRLALKLGIPGAKLLPGSPAPGAGTEENTRLLTANLLIPGCVGLDWRSQIWL